MPYDQKLMWGYHRAFASEPGDARVALRPSKAFCTSSLQMATSAKYPSMTHCVARHCLKELERVVIPITALDGRQKVAASLFRALWNMHTSCDAALLERTRGADRRTVADDTRSEIGAVADFHIRHEHATVELDRIAERGAGAYDALLDGHTVARGDLLPDRRVGGDGALVARRRERRRGRARRRFGLLFPLLRLERDSRLVWAQQPVQAAGGGVEVCLEVCRDGVRADDVRVAREQVGAHNYIISGQRPAGGTGAAGQRGAASGQVRQDVVRERRRSRQARQQGEHEGQMQDVHVRVGEVRAQTQRAVAAKQRRAHAQMAAGEVGGGVQGEGAVIGGEQGVERGRGGLGLGGGLCTLLGALLRGGGRGGGRGVQGEGGGGGGGAVGGEQRGERSVGEGVDSENEGVGGSGRERELAQDVGGAGELRGARVQRVGRERRAGRGQGVEQGRQGGDVRRVGDDGGGRHAGQVNLLQGVVQQRHVGHWQQRLRRGGRWQRRHAAAGAARQDYRVSPARRGRRRGRGHRAAGAGGRGIAGRRGGRTVALVTRGHEDG